MDGLSRAIGAGSIIKLGDKVYQIGPMTLGVYGAVEQYLLSKRKDPLALIRDRIEDFPEHLQKVMVELAYKDLKKENKVDFAEVHQFIHSQEGSVFVVWHLVRSKHPDVTYEEVNAASQKDPIEFAYRMAELVDQLGGTDLKGKLIGQILASKNETAILAIKNLLGDELFASYSTSILD